MTTNELRIGNYLQWNGRPFKVNTIFTNHVCSETQPLQGYEPIELTPEVLKKIGSEFNRNKLLMGFLYYNFDDCKIYFKHEEKNGVTYSLKIAHLHQLQNLYFALTGQELEITL